MCKQCHGNGGTYTEIMAGVWHIKPCLSCRQEREQRFKERMDMLRRKVKKAYERLEVGESSNRTDTENAHEENKKKRLYLL